MFERRWTGGGALAVRPFGYIGDLAVMRYFTSSVATLLILTALLMTAVVAAQEGGGTTKKPETKAPTAQKPPQPDDGAPRIALAEAHAALEKGTAIFVDVRGEDSYRVGHIKGARWMPDIAQRIKELPRDKLIITYCS
ncbi:MAG TPA: rhodanese-like domain-containing protein [Pyrinomonadaceae bacterium]|jgi:hypothetical protein|nr:rhodanese-like domain-containing protein [Pyrinomonadaceae bacterium]